MFVLPAVQAQDVETDSAPPPVRFGVKIGPNFGSLNGLQLRGSGAGFFDLEVGARTGLAIGGFAIVPLANALLIQPELLYVQKGAQIEVTGLASGSGTFKLGYLEIPILLRFDIPIDQSTQGVQIQPYVLGGPSLGLKLHASTESTGDLFETQDFDDITKAYDIGLTAGAGAGYDTDFGTAVAEIRYTLGVTNISSLSEESFRNRGIMITVGFLF